MCTLCTLQCRTCVISIWTMRPTNERKGLISTPCVFNLMTVERLPGRQSHSFLCCFWFYWSNSCLMMFVLRKCWMSSYYSKSVGIKTGFFRILLVPRWPLSALPGSSFFYRWYHSFLMVAATSVVTRTFLVPFHRHRLFSIEQQIFFEQKNPF